MVTGVLPETGARFQKANQDGGFDGGIQLLDENGAAVECRKLKWFDGYGPKTNIMRCIEGRAEVLALLQAGASPADAVAKDQAAPREPRIIVVLGPPCSGKGTQSKKIAAATGVVHLSTGDIFREAIKSGTELGAVAKAHMDRKEFVPDDIVTAFVLEQLKRPDVVERGALLDGFPRTADQARALLRACGSKLLTLKLEVPRKLLVQRAAGRLINSETGEIYHTQFFPPPPGAPTVERQFDRDKKAFRTRLQVFDDQLRRTLPLLGKVVRVSGAQEPDAVFAALMRVIDKAAAPPAQPSAPPSQDATCVICFDRIANYLVVPCGHQCGCQECLNIVMQKSGNCPICRTRIESVQKVFRVGGPGDGTVPVDPGPITALHADPMETQEDEDEWPEWPAPAEEEEEEAAAAGSEAQVLTLTVVPQTDVPASGAECVNVCVQVEVPEMVSAASTVSWSETTTPTSQSGLKSPLNRHIAGLKREASIKRSGVDIACVIDTSGSMCSFATREDEEGNVVNDGINILDIVKHAVKTVIHTLGDDDR